MSEKIIVSGVGCCLVDLLYDDIDFCSEKIQLFFSKKRGDGGLTPGHLVFKEEFEKQSGTTFELALRKITGGKNPDKINIGGPSIVSLINVAQITDNKHCEVRFYGRGGNDDAGKYIISSLQKTPVILKDYKLIDSLTPSTVVLSDPTYENGHGERIFINSIAAAWEFHPEELDDDFFKSNIVVFGGTGLVPQIHDDLTNLLMRSKSNGAITIVNTVFDFRNEKANPELKWPLGESDKSYRYIDLLVTDKEEALRLSGKYDLKTAIKFFQKNKVSSLIITNGAKNISIWSDGRFFNKSFLKEMQISKKVTDDLKNSKGGDTTGCGDNFVGGVIASVVSQLKMDTKQPDIEEACSWGIVSGGFACFYLGGTYFEDNAGEKEQKMQHYYDAYRKQIEN